MKKTLLTLSLFISIVNLYAQENLSNGYIITNSNDTIWGQIDLRTPIINQQRCVFFTDSNTSKTYLPGEIKSYRFTDYGKYYISKKITIEENEIFIFTEYLVQGGLNLYYFEYNKQSYYLFEEDGRHFYITQAPDKEKDNKMKTDLKYIGILNFHFQEGSQSLIKLINQAKFRQKYMIAIAKQYNDENCTNLNQDSCVIFENETPDNFGIQTNFSAYTGVQNGIYSNNISEKGSIYPLVGGQVYINNPRWTKSFGVVLDISFSKIENEQSKTKGQGISAMKFNMYTLSSKIGVRYVYSKYKFRPSIEGGFALTYLFKNKSSITYNQHGNTIATEAYDIRKSHPGWYIGAGIEYNIMKKHFIFARLSYDGYTKSDMFQTGGFDNLKLYQLKLGYTF